MESTASGGGTSMSDGRRGWSRRAFVRDLSIAGTAGFLGAHPGRLGAEPPLETTTIRLEWAGGACNAPKYVAEALLRAEGFTDVQYVNKDAKNLSSRRLKALSSGESDFDLMFVPDLVLEVEKANPIVILAGQHAGCFELFASGRIRAVRDLKHKTVAVREAGATEHLFLSVILSYVGIDPVKDIRWVTVPFPEAVQLLTVEKIDAVLGFPPLPQQLRAKKIGHVVLNSTTDRPWWQYFCCMVVGNREFVRRYPVATKRVIRAMMKANDICALTPDQSAQLLVGKGDTTSYDYAIQSMKEIPYARWREYDPEASVRFYALRLHEAGMIKSSPQKIIAQGTDWRFIAELKKELKG
jgi:NitT/TauT family transport system substrate-binding protein